MKKPLLSVFFTLLLFAMPAQPIQAQWMDSVVASVLLQQGQQTRQNYFLDSNRYSLNTANRYINSSREIFERIECPEGWVDALVQQAHFRYPKRTAIRFRQFLDSALVLSDSLWGEENLRTAKIYSSMGKQMSISNLDSAGHYFRKAISILRKLYPGGDNAFAIGLADLGGFFMSHHQPDSALKYLELSVEVKERACGKYFHGCGNIWTWIAELYSSKMELKKAIAAIDKSIRVHEMNAFFKNDQIHLLHKRKGRIWADQGLWQKANAQFLESQDLLDPHSPYSLEQKLSIQSELGLSYIMLGDTFKGIELLEKALLEAKDSLGYHHPLFVPILLHLAIGKQFLGELETALELSIKASEIQYGRPYSPENWRCHNRIGILAFLQKNYSVAIDHFTYGLELLPNESARDSLHQGILLTNLGSTRCEVDDLKNGMNDLSAAERIFGDLFSEYNPYLANLNRILGLRLLEGGTVLEPMIYSKKSFPHMAQALELGNDTSKTRSFAAIIPSFLPTRRMSFEDIQTPVPIIHLNGDSTTLLEGIQYLKIKGIQRLKSENTVEYLYFGEDNSALLNSTSLTISLLLAQNSSPWEKLETQIRRAWRYENLYHKSPTKPQNGYHALKEYIRAIEIIDSTCHAIDSESQKILYTKYQSLYERAIQLSVALAKQEKDSVQLLNALYLIDNGNSTLYKRSIQNGHANAILINEYEEYTRRDSLVSLLVIQEQKYHRNHFNEFPNPDSVRKNHRLALEIRTKLRNGPRHKNTAPLFPQFICSHFSTAKEIQSILIDDETAVVEYFWGRENLTMFIVTHDVLEFQITPIHGSLWGYIDFMNYYLRVGQRTENESAQFSYKSFAISSEAIFQKILAPLLIKLPKQPNHLIIVPSGPLWKIPFEALINQPISLDTVQDFANLPFLLKDFRISYLRSIVDLKSKENDDAFRDDKYDILAFAPAYENWQEPAPLPIPPYQPRKPNSLFQRIGVRSGSPQPLKYSIPEAQALKHEYRAFSLTGHNATEAQFWNLASSAKILHLGAHGSVNPEAPEFSNIALLPSSRNGVECDGYLDAAEIANSNLNAELVVLPVCNSGKGPNQTGEGLQSLALAFRYAGCPNVIASKWEVDDESAMNISLNFYENLSNGMTTAEALRQAKLKQLREGGTDKAHPFYWAPMVLIGEDRVIEVDKGTRFEWSKWFFIGFLVLIVSSILIRKRKRILGNNHLNQA